ncbi:hypothetical protein JR316_0006655 [Psilocybe cubensis]|uniref:Uncharacterized protein n=2 Tax=Psilocybe cubensis TaxID=181762 RepID=A0A8H7XP60_PSICU|nr:hypothetical protein JR316_0006655 [Psilocybe cubensis]KAH9480058.1 hypothetical protein JR316_0006655 [Psilocybe cubensis]
MELPLPKENVIQDQDNVHQKVKESVHRTVQTFVALCHKQEEAKFLAALSPKKLDMIAKNISEGLILPDNVMEPEEQDSLDQITLFLVLGEVIPPSFYIKKHRGKKANSLLKSALERSSYNSSKETQQAPPSHPLGTENDNTVSKQPSET